MNSPAIIKQSSTAVVDAHTAQEIRAQVHRIQEVMKSVMKDGAHYGVIPGTQKPTLYKAGSEVLLSTFRIAVDPEVIDLSTADEIRYRVIARGVHMNSGITVGAGLGEASSSEEKYKWRAAVCDEEYEETDPDRRRVKWGSKWGQKRGERVTSKIQQVRTSPADVANTVLKMAKKRAQIDLTLTALAASDIFTQDVEDMPDEMREVADDSPPEAREAPQAATGPEVATAAQIGLIRKKLETAGADEIDLLAALGAEKLETLPFSKVNDALAWIKARK